MRHRRRPNTQNMARPNTTEAISVNPERIALDTLIQISNEASPQDLDLRILRTEESEILPVKSVELPTKLYNSSQIGQRGVHSGRQQNRSRSAYINTGRQGGKSNRLLPNNCKLGSTRQKHPGQNQQVSSNTVFIRKADPYRKVSKFKNSLNNTARSFGSQSKPSHQHPQFLDRTVCFNYTINLGSRNAGQQVRRILDSTDYVRKTETTRLPSTSNIASHSGSYTRRKNRLSILNLEFHTQIAAGRRQLSFC